jgi:hypothetical protein
MILECNLSHRFLQTISNCKEKVGPLKIWELLTESVGGKAANVCGQYWLSPKITLE